MQAPVPSSARLMWQACIQMCMSRQLNSLCVMLSITEVDSLHLAEQMNCRLLPLHPSLLDTTKILILTPLTWYWYNWRKRGQEMKWLRCIAITNAPLCGEFMSAATAWRSRAVIPVTCVFPWRMRASSCPRACCSDRASGRRFEFCHRGSGFSGKSW